ncbi:metal-sulfur cluster assembly factor [candidate division WOR-3 bacterium]|jgi:metal-sulfur cluster biosynthetic enzyme|nr:metal-sulfur cluster assembly factor [candidate division WOR-3 bacterium]MCK4334544.1 metal-sulfur cluster assembly factor [candidate division WOR-3 bacterium]MEA3312062.1 metal-sulfur cluster assembly factor [candidate division WOR-3 bacterium]
MVTKAQVREALKKVIDPEIGINIVDLGLIYDVQVENDVPHVSMTLTVPGCPLANMLTRQAEQAVRAVEGVRDVKLELTWDPPWNPKMMSEDAKRKLGWGE